MDNVDVQCIDKSLLSDESLFVLNLSILKGVVREGPFQKNNWHAVLILLTSLPPRSPPVQ